MCNTLEIGELKFVKSNVNGWHGWKDANCADAFDDIDGWLAADGRSVVLETPCRTIARHPFLLEGREINVYSKLMRAQNDGALKKNELFSLAKWALGPSRAIRILKTTSMMISLGHLCPRPLLAVRRKVKNGHHPNLIVTQEITAPTVESIVLNGKSEDVKDAVIAAGCDLAKLHTDRFLHGDYLPRNTCLENGRIFFLDNDKTSKWFFMPPFSQRRRNLEQFAYNLMLLKGLENCNSELPTIFLEAYFATSPRPDSRRQSDIVLGKARDRWERRRSRTSMKKS